MTFVERNCVLYLNYIRRHLIVLFAFIFSRQRQILLFLLNETKREHSPTNVHNSNGCARRWQHLIYFEQLFHGKLVLDLP